MKNKGKFHYFLHMIRTKIIFVFTVVMLFMLLLLIAFGYRMEQQFVTRLIDTNSGLLQYYSGIMESEFSAAELFFTEQRLQQSVYLDIENAESELDQYLAAYEVRRIFDNSLYETECLDFAFLYCPKNETFAQCSYGLNGMAEQQLTDSVREHIRNGNFRAGQWSQLSVEGAVYLYYVISIHDSWVGGFVHEETLLERIKAEELEAFQFVVLLDEAFCPIGGTYSGEESEKIQSSVEAEKETLDFRGENYILSHAGIGNGAFHLAGLTEKSSIQGKLGTESVVLIVGAIALLGIGIGLVLLLWRSLVTPLSNITDGMLELQKGNFSYQLNEETSSEFAQITKTFNTVGREIERMKIDIYEERLERQKTELQFLQSQLNPHFLINCLNNIRTLVLQERLAEFQTMLIDLGTYLRGNMTMQRLIPLEQEIKNVAAYVQLQKIRYQERFQVEVHIYEELLPIPVPAHIIQTFVENAIKYGLASEGSVNITVAGDLSDDRDDVLVLTIQDDGPGFPPEILEKMQGNSVFIRDGRECVGIANAAMRLRLQFGEMASLKCSNRYGRGACVRLEIPIKEEEL